MRKIIVLIIITIAAGISVHQSYASNSQKAPKKSVNWLTFEELEVKMQDSPRRVIIDVYTTWCKYCKIMDKYIYGNDDVIDYVNANYYVVKFNAEQKDEITFGGRTFRFKPEIGMHELATEIMLGSRSFPTTVIMVPNFLSVSPFGGYMKLPEFEKLIRFFHEGIDQGLSWPDWENSFKQTWKD